MEGYLNILESNDNICLSLSNIPLTGDLSESRLVSVTEESLKDIFTVSEVDEKCSTRLFLSTFNENGFSLSLFPLESYIILESHKIEDINKSAYSLRACRRHDGPFKKGELLDLMIKDIKEPTLQTNLDIVKYLLKDPLNEKQNKIIDLFFNFGINMVSSGKHCDLNETVANATTPILEAILGNKEVSEKLGTTLGDTCVTIRDLLEQTKE
ncbi:hypothetical protein D3C87_887560 [compost metagenome]